MNRNQNTFRIGSKSEPNSREGWDSKASFLIKNKRYEEALSILDKVIELTPDVVNLLPSGRHLFSFNEIYNSNPEYTRALRKKSFILYKLERNKEALK
jgi:tetratricopeptide (TPR) repeat protein